MSGAEMAALVGETLRRTPLLSRRLWGTGDARQFTREMEETILEYFDSRSCAELSLVFEEPHLSVAEQVRFIRKLRAAGMERGRSGPRATVWRRLSATAGRQRMYMRPCRNCK